MVSVVSGVFASARLTGEPLEPRLPATGATLQSWSIDLAHAAVIDRLLSRAAAQRLAPEPWSVVERQMAEWSTQFRPHEVARLGEERINALDEDGAEPDDVDRQVNDLQMARDKRGIGVWIRGRLDSVTFDALCQVVTGLLKPSADENKTLGER